MIKREKENVKIYLLCSLAILTCRGKRWCYIKTDCSRKFESRGINGVKNCHCNFFYFPLPNNLRSWKSFCLRKLCAFTGAVENEEIFVAKIYAPVQIYAGDVAHMWDFQACFGWFPKRFIFFYWLFDDWNRNDFRSNMLAFYYTAVSHVNKHSKLCGKTVTVLNTNGVVT